LDRKSDALPLSHRATPTTAPPLEPFITVQVVFNAVLHIMSEQDIVNS